jgi:hypothetical protein
MIRHLVLVTSTLALAWGFAAPLALAGSGIGLPGFVGSGPGSGIGLPGFVGSGPGFPGVVPNTTPAMPVTPAAPSAVKPYFYNPPPSTLGSVDQQRLGVYRDQLSDQQRDLQRRRMNGSITPQQQRDLWQAEAELDRVSRLLEPCSPAIAGSCGAVPPPAAVSPLQVPLPDVGSRPTIKPN